MLHHTTLLSHRFPRQRFIFVFFFVILKKEYISAVSLVIYLTGEIKHFSLIIHEITEF